MTQPTQANGNLPVKRRSPWRTPIIVLLTIVISVGGGYWLFTQYLFPTSFRPVTLSNKEQTTLDQKLQRIGIEPQPRASAQLSLEPEPYTEADADREVFFTEKELNALLAHNTDLADKLVIDLSHNLASVKLLIPMDPQFPVIGGKTLKVTAGLALSLNQSRPRAVLKGVSVWGVPLPNAWLGNLKNVDLVREFGDDGGFWQAFSEGVEAIEITEGRVRVKLKK